MCAKAFIWIRLILIKGGPRQHRFTRSGQNERRAYAETLFWKLCRVIIVARRSSCAPAPYFEIRKSPKLVAKGLIDNKSSFVQAVAWRRTWTTDDLVYWRHKKSWNQVEIRVWKSNTKIEFVNRSLTVNHRGQWCNTRYLLCRMNYLHPIYHILSRLNGLIITIGITHSFLAGASKTWVH